MQGGRRELRGPVRIEQAVVVFGIGIRGIGHAVLELVKVGRDHAVAVVVEQRVQHPLRLDVLADAARMIGHGVVARLRDDSGTPRRVGHAVDLRLQEPGRGHAVLPIGMDVGIVGVGRHIAVGGVVATQGDREVQDRRALGHIIEQRIGVNGGVEVLLESNGGRGTGQTLVSDGGDVHLVRPFDRGHVGSHRIDHLHGRRKVAHNDQVEADSGGSQRLVGGRIRGRGRRVPDMAHAQIGKLALDAGHRAVAAVDCIQMRVDADRLQKGARARRLIADAAGHEIPRAETMSQ